MARVGASVLRLQHEHFEGASPRGASWRNVGEMERWLTAVAGLGVAAYGLSRAARGNRKAGGLLALGGGALLLRATTGICPAYHVAGVSSLHRDWSASNATESKRALSGRGGINVRERITIARPAEFVYRFWRNLENLPRFMAHVEAVRTIDGLRSHWVMRGPAQAKVEWDAEIVNDEPARVIGWRSLEGADVVNAGSVRFEPAADDRGTNLIVTLQYAPPGGKLGALVARLLGDDPALQLREDLGRLKKLLESR